MLKNPLSFDGRIRRIQQFLLVQSFCTKDLKYNL